MKKTLKFVLLAVLVLALAVAAVGCDGSEPTKEQPKDAAKPKLIAAADATFAPFEFTDPKTGKYVGFDVELIQALCDEAGYELEFRSLAFEGIIRAVKLG